MRILNSVNLLLRKMLRIAYFNERISLQVELATEASSSTTITSVDSLAFAFGATVAINLEALRGKVLLSFGTGGTVCSSQLNSSMVGLPFGMFAVKR